MTIGGVGISPTAIGNAIAAGSVATAESKVRKAEEAMRKASKEWDAFGAGSVVKAVNSGRTLSAAEMTELLVGIYRLVRGTASVLAAEQAALAAVVQSLQVLNRVK